MADKQRRENLKGGRKLQVFNVLYDIIEVVVSLTAGVTAGSAALIGWGLDSTVEVISASTLWWRLHGELEGISEERVRHREKITLHVIASSFLAISIFITYDSVSKLVNQETADWSTLGVIILIVSLVVNPILIRLKYSYGKKQQRVNSRCQRYVRLSVPNCGGVGWTAGGALAGLVVG